LLTTTFGPRGFQTTVHPPAQTTGGTTARPTGGTTVRPTGGMTTDTSFTFCKPSPAKSALPITPGLLGHLNPPWNSEITPASPRPSQLERAGSSSQRRDDRAGTSSRRRRDESASPSQIAQSAARPYTCPNNGHRLAKPWQCGVPDCLCKTGCRDRICPFCNIS
jgi:hypothetical protein